MENAPLKTNIQKKAAAEKTYNAAFMLCRGCNDFQSFSIKEKRFSESPV